MSLASMARRPFEPITRSRGAGGIDLSALGALIDTANAQADVPFAPDDHGLFVDAPGSTVWDPMGDKDVWDDGSAAL